MKSSSSFKRFFYPILFAVLVMGQTESWSQTPKRKQFIETNGAIQTIKRDGNTLYLGGSFTGAGYRSGIVAVVSPSKTSRILPFRGSTEA